MRSSNSWRLGFRGAVLSEGQYPRSAHRGVGADGQRAEADGLGEGRSHIEHRPLPFVFLVFRGVGRVPIGSQSQFDAAVPFVRQGVADGQQVVIAVAGLAVATDYGTVLGDHPRGAVPLGAVVVRLCSAVTGAESLAGPEYFVRAFVVDRVAPPAGHEGPAVEFGADEYSGEAPGAI